MAGNKCSWPAGYTLDLGRKACNKKNSHHPLRVCVPVCFQTFRCCFSNLRIFSTGAGEGAHRLLKKPVVCRSRHSAAWAASGKLPSCTQYETHRGSTHQSLERTFNRKLSHDDIHNISITHQSACAGVGALRSDFARPAIKMSFSCGFRSSSACDPSLQQPQSFPLSYCA